MLSDEEKQALEQLRSWREYIIKHKEDVNKANDIEFYLRTAINLIEKQSKEIEELKREKETNQQMIQLAETQILGYGQGYKDGLNKETTATEIVARERENQIIYEGIKHKINMEWVFKIKAKIEELDEEIKVKREIAKKPMDRVSGRLLTDSIVELEKTKQVLQSLLEKE